MFDQFLRDRRIPQLNYKSDGAKLTYWFTEVVDGFSFPTRIVINQKETTIEPTTQQQILDFGSTIETVELDRNFYFDLKEAKAEEN